MRTSVPILTVLAVAAGLAVIGVAGLLQPVTVTLVVIVVILAAALGAGRRPVPAPPPGPDPDVARVPLVPPPPPGRVHPGTALSRMAVVWGVVVTLTLGTAVGLRNAHAGGTVFDPPVPSYQTPPDDFVGPLPGRGVIDLHGSLDYGPPVGEGVGAQFGPAPEVIVNGEPHGSAEVQIMGMYDPCPDANCEEGARVVAYTIRIRNTGTVPVTPWPGVDCWVEDALGGLYLAVPAEGPAYPSVAAGAEAFRSVEVDVPRESVLTRFHIGLRLGDANRIVSLDSPGS